MARKAIVTLLAFVLVGACCFGVASCIDPAVGAPQAITEESRCPVAGCVNESCHGFDDVPQPDGVHEMLCPENGCASTECHAWDTLMSRYCQASDASLNLWILAPVMLVLALVLLVKRL